MATDPDALLSEWRRLVNMTPLELTAFLRSPWGKVAGLSAEEAREQGIKSGRESARWILKMKRTPAHSWTPEMWRWAGRQVSFIKRMTGMRGRLVDAHGQPTRKLLALLVWGHDPMK